MRIAREKEMTKWTSITRRDWLIDGVSWKKNDCHDRISFYLYCDSFFSSILSAQTHDTRRENKKTFAEKVHMLSFSLSFLKTPPLNSIMFVVQSSAASCHSILAGNLILSMCLERAQNSIELWRCRTLLTPFVLRQRLSLVRGIWTCAK